MTVVGIGYVVKCRKMSRQLLEILEKVSKIKVCGEK